MAKPKTEDFDIESPEEKLENRVAVLEAIVAKHIRYHFGAVYPDK